MFATIAALLITVLHFLGWVSFVNIEASAPYVASVLFTLSLLITIIGMIPLKGMVKMATSSVISLSRYDMWQMASRVYVALFFLFSVVVDISSFVVPFVLYLGLSLDAVIFHLRRTISYLDPSFVIQKIVKTPPSSWDVYDQLRPLYEMGYKAITHSHVSLCEEVLQGIEQIARSYLTRMEKDKADVGELDYFLGDLFQHLDPITQESIVYGYEPVVNKIIVFAGKIAIHVCQFHMEESSVPLHYLGHYAELSVEKNLREVGAHATVTLQTVAKMVAQDPQVQKKEIKELFYTLIHHLHRIAKALFTQDRNTSLVLLCDPFHSLKNLFKEGKLFEHPDKEAIMGQLDAVLAEFDALEKVMNAMPPIGPLVYTETP